MSAPQDKGCRDGDSEKAFSSLSQNRRGGLRTPSLSKAIPAYSNPRVPCLQKPPEVTPPFLSLSAL